jgi:AcrR family transcriptional regulator
LRADARRNYDGILVAATAAFAQHGADASLEEIARQAGVGSATLHRHFPSRQVLLEAVFHDHVETLCAQARELAREHDPGPAFITWLRALAAHTSASRGLAASLLHATPETCPPERGPGCHELISEAGGELLETARRAGAVRPQVSIEDLLTLVNAISLATEHTGDPDEATRLLDIAIDGIHPRAH